MSAAISSSIPLVSVGVLASTSIDKLDALLASVSQQTYGNLEILVSGGSIPGPALIHYLRRKQASDARIKYVPCQDVDGQTAPFLSLIKSSAGEFFTFACNTMQWDLRFVERCVAEIGSHGSAMSGVNVKGKSAHLPLLGGQRSRYRNLWSFFNYPTAAILLGVHRTSWIKEFIEEAANSSNSSRTLLQSVLRGHHKVFAEALCSFDGEDSSGAELLPPCLVQGIEDLRRFSKDQDVSVLRKREFIKTFLPALREHLSEGQRSRHASELPLMAREESKESFSQSGEDMIVDFVFGAMQIQHPTYLDLGAHHPSLYSNTRFFYKKGSRGVNVEADPALFERFVLQRPLDVNLNVGVGVGNTGALPFYVMSVPTLNTFSKQEAERCVAMGTHQIVDVIDVPLRDVNELIAENFAGEAPDFISIDVEGLDFEIVKSIDLSRYRPVVICVETITFSENFDGMKIAEIGEYLQQNDYILYADTRINSIFVDKLRWRRH